MNVRLSVSKLDAKNARQIGQKAYKIDPNIEKSGLEGVLGSLGGDLQEKNVSEVVFAQFRYARGRPE